jgi:hypothetical protein
MPALTANINSINDIGRQKWQQTSGYNLRSLVETTMGRYKKIINHMVFSKKFKNQQNESKIGCYILNKMTEFCMPASFKVRASN